MAKVELEVGSCPTGVLLSIKTRDGRLHHIDAIEITNEEATHIAELILKRVEQNQHVEEFPESVN